jgi:maltose alpha-D-glucosyltransferase/alpha-amylase
MSTPVADSIFWYKNAIVYALDISRFYDADADGRGDLKGLITKLDYLSDLGVTCIWLLPFHPSGSSDNGYDVTNYMGIDPSIGTLEDFRAFMRAAKQKGLRVIMDLVVHHTSIHHPWFVAATVDKSVKFRDYYLWVDQLSPKIQEEGAFPTVQDGVWQYDENTNSYYRHQFYSFEADLNLANPEVQAEIYAIMDFWLAFGIDGFRVDAAGFFLTLNESTETTMKAADYFKKLRTFIHKRNPEAILVAEADVPAEYLPVFFGNNDRFHLLYNFLLNNYTFYAIATQNASAIVDCIRSQASLRRKGGWLNFVRNADELNLVWLTQPERDEAMSVLAPDPRTQIFGRGIRRRLAPMLENNKNHLRMVYSLLFALPGTPMLFYGEEIGMGDDVSMEGRNSVRCTMQWNNGLNGGFSAADRTQLIANVNVDPEYSPLKINVERELKRNDSLLAFIHQLIELRKTFPCIGSADCTVVSTHNSAVLGLSYRYGKEHLVIFHNFSSAKQTFTRPKALAHSYQTVYGAIAQDDTLSPYGFAWLHHKD